MLDTQSFSPQLATCFEDPGWRSAEPAPLTPRQNHLLSALPREDYERLLPDLEFVSLPAGRTVHVAGDRQKHLYFIVEGILARFYATVDGATAEFAITGKEGVIGVGLVLGGDSTPSQATVLSAGSAYRLRAGRLKSECAHGGSLSRLLMRYILGLMQHIGLIAACNRHHTLNQQLCRFLLSSIDRVPSNELAMTHEVIASMMGVRREGVTEAAGTLQQAGLIHCSRGHISILDRARMEAQACECYAVVKREYEGLYPECRQARLAA